MSIKSLLVLVALFVYFAVVVSASRRGGLRADNGSNGGTRYALSDAVRRRGSLRAHGGSKYQDNNIALVLSDSEIRCLNNCPRGMMCPAVCITQPDFYSDSEFSFEDLMNYVNKAEKVANVLGYKRPQSMTDKPFWKKIKWNKVLDGLGKASEAAGHVQNIKGLFTMSDSASGYKMSNGDALNKVRSAGIAVSSSGGCHDKNNRRCTSLDQVNSGTIDKILTLKRASGCPITITGGTEIGHAGGTYSHSNGYKLDISLNSCINNYITSSFAHAGRRGDGAEMWKASSGSIYAKEGNHWDIMYP